MLRIAWPVAILAALILAVFSGCSVRHGSLLPDRELARLRSTAIDLEAFLDLPHERQAVRMQQAERAATAWGAASAAKEYFLDSQEGPFIHRRPFGRVSRSPSLGDLLAHLEAAVGLDPSRADLWFALGLLRDTASDVRRARRSLETAWHVADRTPERQARSPSLRRDIAVLSAWIERDDGWWDEGLLWLDRAGPFLAENDSEAVLLRGLLLAGRGDLDEAMRLSYGIPEVMVPAVRVELPLDVRKLGLDRERSDRFRTWLQAEVWLRRGRPDLAWYVLGDPLKGRNAPLPHRYWQDIGLYAELAGDSRASDFYIAGFRRQPFRGAYFPAPMRIDPVLHEQPQRFAFFYSGSSGAHVGGSLFAHAASQAMLAQESSEDRLADSLYLQAVEALSVCVRRGIYPAEAAALRGYLRFLRGYDDTAQLDLAHARRRFAADGGIEPRTSHMLGMLCLLSERYDEAEALFEEVVAADSTNFRAWSALGVTQSQLGRVDEALQALDRAVSGDPRNVQVWYNRGLLRSQAGDLAGGLEDLASAARLDPQNLEVGRLIQFVQLAQREGRRLAPVRGVDSDRNPVMVDFWDRPDKRSGRQPAHGGAPWLHQLTSLFGDRLAESSLAAFVEGFDASDLEQLQALYRAESSAVNRKTLAFAHAWLDQPREGHRLLAPHWGFDLDTDEVLLLLWLDHRLGESTRHRELAAGLRKDVSIQIGPWQALGELSEQFSEHQSGLDADGGQPFMRIRDLAGAQYRRRQSSLHSQGVVREVHPLPARTWFDGTFGPRLR